MRRLQNRTADDAAERKYARANGPHFPRFQSRPSTFITTFWPKARHNAAWWPMPTFTKKQTSYRPNSIAWIDANSVAITAWKFLPPGDGTKLSLTPSNSGTRSSGG